MEALLAGGGAVAPAPKERIALPGTGAGAEGGARTAGPRDSKDLVLPDLVLVALVLEATAELTVLSTES